MAPSSPRRFHRRCRRRLGHRSTKRRDSVLPQKTEESVDDPDTGERLVLQDVSGIEQAFIPLERRNFQDAGVEDAMVETLILKQLMITPTALGMEIAKAICLRPKPVLALLQEMKQRKLVQHRSATSTGDFVYALTEAASWRSRTARYRRDARPLPSAPAARSRIGVS